MTRPLVIGPEQQAELARVKAHAEANFFTLDQCRESANSGRSMVHGAGFRCSLPFEFHVCFSVEQHPFGWARHLSVSIGGPGSEGRLPSVAALEMIGRELGMRMDLASPSTHSYFEPPVGIPVAISVIERIEGPR